MPQQNRRYAPEPPPLPKCKGHSPASPPPPRVAEGCRAPKGGLLPMDILESLGLGGRMDSDRILILGLLFLLSGEDCDRLLLMALLYILL